MDKLRIEKNALSTVTTKKHYVRGFDIKIIVTVRNEMQEQNQNR